MANQTGRPLVLHVNDQEYSVLPEMCNVPLSTFLKGQAPIKSVKVACGEGGCGACAVALVEERDGRPHLRTINSCLAPVYSVLGRSVVTAEGIPAAATGGVSLVADRLASFHASQCGYCTPGFTVACHAALRNAAVVAAKGRAAAGGSEGGGPLPGQQPSGGAGGRSVNDGEGGGGGGTDGGGSLLADGALIRALDGNLCRCTGYRPIVAACRSLAVEVGDIEDLCPGAPGVWATAAAPAAAAVAAGASAGCCGGGLTSGHEVPAAGAMEEVALGAGQVLKAPHSLNQLVAEAGRLEAAAAAAAAAGCDVNGGRKAEGGGGFSWRLVAGNTGHGVYKDWPVEDAVLLSVIEVPELHRLDLVAAASSSGQQGEEAAGGRGGGRVDSEVGRQPHLHIGACTTLERLAAMLADLAQAAAPPAPPAAAAGTPRKASAAAHAATGGIRQWAAETSAHLHRIAGRHVRNAATVGGNLALARERSLPSDLAPLLGAAGAEVELVVVSADATAHGSVVRVDLMDFLAEAAPVPPRCSYILTALRVPLPPADPRVRFWSQRIGERYSNAAAVANAAVMVRMAAAEENGGGEVVAAVRIVIGVRTPGGGAAAGGTRVSEHNAAKLTDASAVLLDGWRCVRAVAAEAALLGRTATVSAVAAALAALESDDLAAVRADDLAAAAAGEDAAAEAIAQGLVAQGLMACLGLSLTAEARLSAAANGGHHDGDVNGHAADTPNGDENGQPEAAAPPPPPPPARMPPPQLVEGHHYLPEPVPELAPVTLPIPKLGSKLQAAGTAHYTEDVPVHDGALYGAYVLSARAGPMLEGLDPSPALALPGVVRFLAAADLPGVGAVNWSERAARGAPEPLFVQLGGRCEFAGQAVGLVLGTSSWAAQRGAKAVLVQYGSGGDTPPPLLTLADAVRAGSFYEVSSMLPWLPKGTSYGGKSCLVQGGASVEEALAAAGATPAAAMTAAALAGTPGSSPGGAVAAAAAESGSAAAEPPPPPRPPPPRPPAVRVVSGRYSTPSQLHFYMESQSAVAWPDEDGTVVVHSSCQGTDTIQSGVATALGIPFNKVLARCRRVGGAFGGKATFSRRVAAVAAIAAVATGRQVRILVPRNTDMAMCGGRCDTDVSFVAVLDVDEPKSAVGAAVAALPRLRALDLHLVLQGGAYADISASDVYGILAALDGLYDIPAVRIEAALTRCNLPPRTAVRGPGEIQGTMILEQILEHVAVELRVDPEALRQANFLRCPPTAGPDPVDTATPSAAAGEPAARQEAAPPAVVKTCLGKPIPLRLYTLPHLWKELQRLADWQQLQADVESFNAANTWRKRGLAMLPVRYGMNRGRKPAYVSILQDGTVLVACHGIEMGQGLFTKVAQVAAMTLSEVLPASRRPLDLDLIRIADNSSELLPNGGISSSSTTSELACAAVRGACLQLGENLRKHALPKLVEREDYGWADVIAAVPIYPATCPLSAFAFSGQADLPETTAPDAPGPLDPIYHVLGVALAVAELDVLTGERRVLRSDILFDLGRPVNPAVDLGQVEGAFVQGMGMMLQEQITYDNTTGALVQNSTWNYKLPSLSCVPQLLNVHMLNDAPLSSGGPVSSKACGEPPLQLSYTILAALQRAAAAARAGAARLQRGLQPQADAGGAPAAAAGGGGGGQQGPGGFQALLAPATVERVRRACGSWRAVELLQQWVG